MIESIVLGLARRTRGERDFPRYAPGVAGWPPVEGCAITIRRRTGQMNQIRNDVDWIEAYLDWTNPERSDHRASEPDPVAYRVTVEASEGFSAAYLEWMDAAPRAPAFPYRARPAGGATDDLGTLDALREAVLLVALRAESDCIHMLRRSLAAGETTPDAVKLAVEALGHVNRLLDGEQCAWRALSTLRNDEVPYPRAAWRTDPETDWPHALEGVVADMHALSGTVLALHAH
jgi:hypothetical protein